MQANNSRAETSGEGETMPVAPKKTVEVTKENKALQNTKVKDLRVEEAGETIEDAPEKSSSGSEEKDITD